MVLKKARSSILLGMLLALAACGRSGEPVPVPIYEGEDVCDTCHMLIGDDRFAAECVMKKERVKKFDDIICMVRYFDSAKTSEGATRDDVRAYFVKDYATRDWLDAKKAYFVKADITTPMGSGTVAFKQEKRAIIIARANEGKLLTFDDLWNVFKQATVKREITIRNGVMTPEVVSVKYGDLVQIRIDVEDNKEYKLAIKGYEADGLFPTASRGHSASLKLKADRPGDDFSFIDTQTNAELGRFRVEGAHFPEEMKKR
jgi:copper chaperone NosL